MIDATNYETAIGLVIVLSVVSLLLLVAASRAAPPSTPPSIQVSDDSDEDISQASAWLVPSGRGGMSLIRR